MPPPGPALHLDRLPGEQGQTKASRASRASTGLPPVGGSARLAGHSHLQRGAPPAPLPGLHRPPDPPPGRDAGGGRRFDGRYTRPSCPGATPGCAPCATPRTAASPAPSTAGIGAGSGEIVVLLNNDTEADPRWLEALVRPLETEPGGGLLRLQAAALRPARPPALRRRRVHPWGGAGQPGGLAARRRSLRRGGGGFRRLRRGGRVPPGSCWKTWGASTSGCTPTWRTSTSPGGPSCGGIAAATSPRRGSITRSAPRPAGCAPATTAGATSSSSWPATSPPPSCAATGGQVLRQQGEIVLGGLPPHPGAGGAGPPRRLPGRAGGLPHALRRRRGCRAPAAPPWSAWRPSSPRRAREGP